MISRQLDDAVSERLKQEARARQRGRGLLEFIEGQHLYIVGGIVRPSVTEILTAVGVATDFDALPESVQASIEYRRNLGSAVHADTHALDDNDLDLDRVPAETRPYLDAWATCKANLGLRPMARERRLFHPVHEYCGTLDGIFERELECATVARRVLIDLKIGDPWDAAVHLQTAAYEAAYLAEHANERIDERWAVQLTPATDPPYRVIKLAPDLTRRSWTDFPKFLACLTTYREQAVRRTRGDVATTTAR